MSNKLPEAVQSECYRSVPLLFGETSSTSDSPQTDKSASNRKRNGCYNCDEVGHSVNDCPEPRNARKINENRRKQQLNQQNNGTRFYKEDSSIQYQPGQISDELRAALGLRDSSALPSYIYRMRDRGLVQGYPPGHLQNALASNRSNLLDFHLSSKHNVLADEDGEVHDEGVDEEKIIWFEGFNCEPSIEAVDPHQDKEYTYPSRSDFIDLINESVEAKVAEQKALELKEAAAEQSNNKKSKKQNNEEPVHTVFDSDSDAEQMSTDTTLNTPDGRTLNTQVGDSVGSSTATCIPLTHTPNTPSAHSLRQGIVPFEPDAELTQPASGAQSMNRLLKQRRNRLSLN